MLLRSPRLTFALIVAIAALVGVALYVGRPRLPDVPEHPYLDAVPQDVGEVKLEGPLENHTDRAVLHVAMPVPHELEIIEPLDECPRKELWLFWKRRRLGVGLRLEETLSYETFDAALAAVPAATPPTRKELALLILKAMCLPRTGDSLTIRRFSLYGLKGFQLEPDDPIESRRGRTTTYYLFPEGPDPALQVDVVERRRTLERTEESLHAVVAGMSYPAVGGDETSRLRHAIYASEHGQRDVAMFEAVALTCGVHRREGLSLTARMAITLHKFEIGREAIRAMMRLYPGSPEADNLMGSLHDLEQEVTEKRARGGEPEPTPKKPSPSLPWVFDTEKPREENPEP
ncbi:MAG: hypothetical protein JSV08_07445 [Acidobacteriota bacterium]|nr:MAG: hypothetical protein JSV08_07445 [Acidobacteriota bacterium]